MSSIERANHQHPSTNTQHLSAHQHLTLNTHHPTLRSLKLAKEAGIVLREEAEIAYTVLEVSNTLNTHLSNLRKKLHQLDPNHEYIETIWGVGVRLKGDK